MPAKSTTDMTNDKVGIKKPIFQRAKAYIVVHAGYAKRVCQKSSVNAQARFKNLVTMTMTWIQQIIYGGSEVKWSLTCRHRHGTQKGLISC